MDILEPIINSIKRSMLSSNATGLKCETTRQNVYTPFRTGAIYDYNNISCWDWTNKFTHYKLGWHLVMSVVTHHNTVVFTPVP